MKAPGVAAVSGTLGALLCEIRVAIGSYWREQAKGSRRVGPIVARWSLVEALRLGLIRGKLTDSRFGFDP